MKIFDTAIIFKTIVDQGSMIGAANTLCVTPSVVTKKLSKLEEQLGLQLLKRTTRHMELTEAGEVFYERISKISSTWDASIEEVISLNSNPKGTLQISCPQPLCSRLIVPILYQFQAQYPEIRLELLNIKYKQLPHHCADITICRKLDDFDSTNYVGIPLFVYQNSLFASKNYLNNNPEITQIEDLEEQQCITYSIGKSIYQWEFENNQHVIIEPYMSTDSTETIISAAVSGLGIAYIPEEIIKTELANDQLTRVLPDIKSRRFETYLYYQNMKFMPQKQRLFIDFLKSYF